MNNVEVSLRITLAFALGRIRSLVAAQPDRLGTTDNDAGGGGGCVYAVMRDGVLTPICIVGQFFADLGLLGLLVAYTDAGTVKYQEGACVTQASMWKRFEAAGITVDDDAKNFLYTVQQFQDVGGPVSETGMPMPWGDALSAAVLHLRVEEENRIEAKVSDLRKQMRADSALLNVTY